MKFSFAEVRTRSHHHRLVSTWQCGWSSCHAHIVLWDFGLIQVGRGVLAYFAAGLAMLGASGMQVWSCFVTNVCLTKFIKVCRRTREKMCRCSWLEGVSLLFELLQHSALLECAIQGLRRAKLSIYPCSSSFYYIGYSVALLLWIFCRLLPPSNVTETTASK